MDRSSIAPDAVDSTSEDRFAPYGALIGGGAPVSTYSIPTRRNPRRRTLTQRLTQPVGRDGVS